MLVFFWSAFLRIYLVSTFSLAFMIKLFSLQAKTTETAKTSPKKRGIHAVHRSYSNSLNLSNVGEFFRTTNYLADKRVL